MPAPLNAARSFVKLINTRRRIMVSQVDTGAAPEYAFLDMLIFGGFDVSNDWQM